MTTEKIDDSPQMKNLMFKPEIFNSSIKFYI